MAIRAEKEVQRHQVCNMMMERSELGRLRLSLGSSPFTDFVNLPDAFFLFCKAMYQTVRGKAELYQKYQKEWVFQG